MRKGSRLLLTHIDESGSDAPSSSLATENTIYLIKKKKQ